MCVLGLCISGAFMMVRAQTSNPSASSAPASDEGQAAILDDVHAVAAPPSSATSDASQPAADSDNSETVQPAVAKPVSVRRLPPRPLPAQPIVSEPVADKSVQINAAATSSVVSFIPVTYFTPVTAFKAPPSDISSIPDVSASVINAVSQPVSPVAPPEPVPDAASQAGSPQPDSRPPPVDTAASANPAPSPELAPGTSQAPVTAAEAASSVPEEPLPQSGKGGPAGAKPFTSILDSIAGPDGAAEAAGSSSDNAAPDASSAAASPSANVTVNLISLMVKRGLITKDDAGDLIAQAQKEAAAAQATAAQVAAAAPGGSGGSTEGGEGNEGDSVSVNYIPDTVRQQMQSEIEQDVMNTARNENWATPRSFPTWASRMTFFGDTRFRFEDLLYPKGNANNGSFFNFNSINTGPPLNNIPGTPTPFYNVDQNRDRVRLRARFGVDVALDDGFTTGLRLGTGSDDNPDTENQTLGGTTNNGEQGGEFGKYSIWLDRAFIKYRYGNDPDRNFSATVGRFENPFMHTSMIYADDLGFDGAMVQGTYKVAEGVKPFATVGAFPVFNTDLNFASTNPAKYGSEDKWLYAGQVGTDWMITPDYSVKGAVAYYDYETVQGKLSDPFIPLTSSDQGNTDDSRPSFAQNGNTYFPIRNIDNSTAANNFGAADQYQYYGLASAFRELALTGQFDVSKFDPFHIQLTGEVVKNLAFNQSSINAVAINNLGSNGSFNGGDTGYMVRMLLGAPSLLKQWDWNVAMSYRYVESDATVDAFTDADFGGILTGTNLQGYTIGGNVALSPRVWLGLRWMSADAIAGPTYKNDLFQFDINSKF